MGISVYVISFVITIGLIYSKKYIKESQQKYILFLAPVPIFIVSALRYDVGTDYMFTYAPYFRFINGQSIPFYMRQNPSVDRMEIGFKILNQVLGLISKNEQIIFIVTSFIFVFFTFICIYRDSPIVCFSVLLLFLELSFFRSMNYVRQSLTLVIFMYALKFIKEKNCKKYLLCIIIAALIHRMALLYIPIYFIANIRIDRKIMIFSIPAIYFGSNIFRNILEKLLQNTVYGFYLNSNYDSNIFYTRFFAISLLTLLLGMYFYDNKDKMYNVYFNLQFIYVIICTVSNIIPNADRMIHMFSMLEIIFISMIISKTKLIKRQNRYIVKWSLYLLYIIIFIRLMYVDILVQNQHEILPYQWYFSIK